MLTENGLILRGSQMVPEKLQERAVNLAHEGQGITKTKQLLRSKVWFPEINKQVEQIHKSCSCQAAIDPSSEYIMVVHCDYSRSVLPETVYSTSAKVICDRLERLFGKFGIPDEIRTDNGPKINNRFNSARRE